MASPLSLPPSPATHRRSDSASSISSTRSTHSTHSVSAASRALPSPSPKNNPHPYAIKTTSTALLSRSNSSGHNVHSAYHYVPASPGPSPSPSDPRLRRHSHTRSYDGSPSPTRPDALPPSPRPLPVPPSMDSPSRHPTGWGALDDDTPDSTPPWRTRSHSLRTDPTSPMPTGSTDVLATALQDLPPNPKQWSPSQLSTYLATSLQLHSKSTDAATDAALPIPIIKDITAWIRQSRLSGKAFLRLTDRDLEGMGVNHLWRTALLDASRSLRQNVLQGSLWGFDEDLDGAAPPQPPTDGPYANPDYASSASSVDDPADATRKSRPRRSGRVKGMVATFERSASESDASVDDADDSALGHDATADSGPKKRRDRRPLPPVPSPSPPPSARRKTKHASTNAPGDAEELSMEALLASGGGGSWGAGAEAWENVPAGMTVKRIVPSPEHIIADNPLLSPEHSGGPAAPGSGAGIVGVRTGGSAGSGSGSGKSSGRGSAGERRVGVRDIFSPQVTGTALGEVPVIPDDDEGLADIEEEAGPGVDPSLDEFPPLGPTTAGSVPQADTSAPVPATASDPADGADPLAARLRALEAKLAEVEERDALREREHRVRLAEVEARERALREREAASSPSPVPVSVPASTPTPATQTPPAPAPAPAPSALIPRAFHYFYTQAQRARATGHAFAGAFAGAGDPSVAALPSYVLLVSIGMCAVILRVVMRKLTGRR